jgi:hypothetical protein
MSLADEPRLQKFLNLSDKAVAQIAPIVVVATIADKSVSKRPAMLQPPK